MTEKDLITALRICAEDPRMNEADCTDCPSLEQCDNTYGRMVTIPFAVITEATDMMEQMLTKLAIYEEAEKQGRLFMYPVKEGTKVYRLLPSLGAVCSINFWPGSYRPEDFGKIIFLTREEAEKARLLARLAEIEE